MLALEELDGPTSTQLGNSLTFTASSFTSLSEMHRKEAVLKSWGNKSELVEMLNRECPPCLVSLFKGEVYSDVRNFFDRRQYFDQLSQEKLQGSGHASPLNYNSGGHR